MKHECLTLLSNHSLGAHVGSALLLLGWLQGGKKGCKWTLIVHTSLSENGRVWITRHASPSFSYPSFNWYLWNQTSLCACQKITNTLPLSAGWQESSPSDNQHSCWGNQKLSNLKSVLCFDSNMWSFFFFFGHLPVWHQIFSCKALLC